MSDPGRGLSAEREVAALGQPAAGCAVGKRASMRTSPTRTPRAHPRRSPATLPARSPPPSTAPTREDGVESREVLALLGGRSSGATADACRFRLRQTGGEGRRRAAGPGHPRLGDAAGRKPSTISARPAVLGAHRWRRSGCPLFVKRPAGGSGRWRATRVEGVPPTCPAAMISLFCLWRHRHSSSAVWPAPRIAVRGRGHRVTAAGAASGRDPPAGRRL
jgi:hypothetical protein